MSAAKQNAIE